MSGRSAKAILSEKSERPQGRLKPTFRSTLTEPTSTFRVSHLYFFTSAYDAAAESLILLYSRLIRPSTCPSRKGVLLKMHMKARLETAQVSTQLAVSSPEASNLMLTLSPRVRRFPGALKVIPPMNLKLSRWTTSCV